MAFTFHLVAHGCANHAGTDSNHTNTLRRVLERRSLGKADHAMLGVLFPPAVNVESRCAPLASAVLFAIASKRQQN